jgi:hypothetical protein
VILFYYRARPPTHFHANQQIVLRALDNNRKTLLEIRRVETETAQ